MMEQCWTEEPEDRPTFKDLQRRCVFAPAPYTVVEWAFEVVCYRIRAQTRMTRLLSQAKASIFLGQIATLSVQQLASRTLSRRKIFLSLYRTVKKPACVR